MHTEKQHVRLMACLKGKVRVQQEGEDTLYPPRLRVHRRGKKHLWPEASSSPFWWSQARAADRTSKLKREVKSTKWCVATREKGRDRRSERMTSDVNVFQSALCLSRSGLRSAHPLLSKTFCFPPACAPLKRERERAVWRTATSWSRSASRSRAWSPSAPWAPAC